MSDSGALAVGIVLLLLNAFFVAAEFAVISARRSQIEPRARAGSRRARTTLLAMENVTVMIATAQLGITLCSVGLGAVAEPAVAHLLEPLFLAAGVPASVGHALAFTLALAVVVSLHVVVGEMVPKNFAISMPDSAALLVVPGLVAVSAVLRPVVVALNSAANVVLRLLRVTPRDEVASAFTLEEVSTVVSASQREGTLDDDSGVLSGAIGVTGLSAADLVLPLAELRTVGTDVTPARIELLVADTGFSRFVVVGDDDEPIGYLHLKDVLGDEGDAYERPVPADRLRPLVAVAAEDHVGHALAAMQRAGSHIARVVDDGGALAGILFFEDVIEEIVGEVRDDSQRAVAGRMPRTAGRYSPARSDSPARSAGPAAAATNPAPVTVRRTAGSGSF